MSSAAQRSGSRVQVRTTSTTSCLVSVESLLVLLALCMLFLGDQRERPCILLLRHSHDRPGQTGTQQHRQQANSFG